jgi:hypothetical protein
VQLDSAFPHRCQRFIAKAEPGMRSETGITSNRVLSNDGDRNTSPTPKGMDGPSRDHADSCRSPAPRFLPHQLTHFKHHHHHHPSSPRAKASPRPQHLPIIHSSSTDSLRASDTSSTGFYSSPTAGERPWVTASVHTLYGGAVVGQTSCQDGEIALLPLCSSYVPCVFESRLLSIV